MAVAKAQISVRIDMAGGRFGPGKAALLRAIDKTGSISAAARELGMSYARAWKLVEAMNTSFRSPLVETFAGGSQRGGAQLTEAGAWVMELYFSVVSSAEAAAAEALKSFGRMAR